MKDAESDTLESDMNILEALDSLEVKESKIM
jgi:hypothetical protein